MHESAIMTDIGTGFTWNWMVDMGCKSLSDTINFEVFDVEPVDIGPCYTISNNAIVAGIHDVANSESASGYGSRTGKVAANYTKFLDLQ